MRYLSYAASAAILFVCCARGAMAAESSGSSWWWPFGGEKEAPHSAVYHQPAPRPATKQDTAWKPSWPTLPTPRLWPSKQETNAVRNSWADTNKPEEPSPWQTVTDSAHRIGEGTSNAWHKTLDVLNPFDGPKQTPQPRVATNPGWRNWFRVEEDKHEGPQTVTEWMAQQRLNP